MHPMFPAVGQKLAHSLVTKCIKWKVPEANRAQNSQVLNCTPPTHLCQDDRCEKTSCPLYLCLISCASVSHSMGISVIGSRAQGWCFGYLYCNSRQGSYAFYLHKPEGSYKVLPLNKKLESPQFNIEPKKQMITLLHSMVRANLTFMKL